YVVITAVARIYPILDIRLCFVSVVISLQLPCSALFPYTTLFRSQAGRILPRSIRRRVCGVWRPGLVDTRPRWHGRPARVLTICRQELGNYVGFWVFWAVKVLDCRHMNEWLQPAMLSVAVDGDTLAEQVFRRIQAAIVQGEIAPGSKISEPELARTYGISRGPLREAIHRL